MGTMTITGNEVAVQSTEDQLNPTVKGECFTIRSKDDECFVIRSKEDPCFFINRTQEEEEILDPPPTIDVENFSSIKCVQTNGHQELIIIGLYTPPPDGTERAVIAKFTFIPTGTGSVFELESAPYYYEDLAYFKDDLDEPLVYEDVDRLDSWDLESSLSKMCIVLTNKTAVWINTVVFTQYDAQPNANDCFYDEDTYSVVGGVGTWENVKPWWGSTLWQGCNPPNCTLGGWAGDCSYGASPYWYYAGQDAIQSIQTRSQKTAEVIQTDGNYYSWVLSWSPAPTVEVLKLTFPDACDSDGEVATRISRPMIVKREGIAIVKEANNNSCYFLKHDDFNTSDYGWRFSNANFGGAYVERRNPVRGVFVGGSAFVALGGVDPETIGKIYRGSVYTMIGIGGSTRFYDNATNEFITIDNRNVTLMRRATLEADGTGTLIQKILEEEFEAQP